MMDGFRPAPQQKRLWALRQADPDGRYFAQIVAEIDGAVDPERIRAALELIARRHEILRTSLVRPEGMALPLQVIAEEPVVELRCHDLRDGTDHDWARTREERAGTATRGGPVLYADLATVPGGGSRLMLTVPAATADVASLYRLLVEVEAGYERGDASAPAADVLQYADAAEWQLDLLTAEETASQRAFWERATVVDDRPGLLPFEQDATSSGRFRPAGVAARVDGEVAGGVRKLTEAAGRPAWVVVATAWRATLSRIVDRMPPLALFGLNRRHEELRDAVGPFGVWLPHPGELPTGVSFAEALGHVAGQVSELARHEQFRDVGASGDLPLTRLAFGWSVAPRQRWTVSDAVSYGEPFAAMLDVTEDGDALRVTLRHDTTRVTAVAARTLLAMCLHLLGAAVREPDRPWQELPLEPLRSGGRRPDPSERGRPALVHEMVAAQATTRPDAIAVVADDASLTYRELHERSAGIAARLGRVGIAPDSAVGLVADRSATTVAALLGIMMAGAAYAPIDPAWPDDRIAEVLAAGRIGTVLGRGATLARLPEDRTGVDLDAADGTTTGSPGAGRLVAPEQLAYLIFTSGSTGVPKGVGVPHASLARYVHAVVERFGLTADDRHLHLSTLAADLGNTSLFGALCTGATLHLASAELARDACSLREYAHRAGITVLKAVPSHLRALLDGDHPARLLPARHLILGGEASDWSLIDTVSRLRPDLTVTNHYGPTETTVGVLTHTISGNPRTADAPPLGSPLPHSTVRVLDGELRPTAPWVPGEIYIGGAAVARGYQHQPAVTAGRFVPDPGAATPGARLYRSGDRARRLPDGTLVFLGRTDQQLKVRGHRVEPAEIEHVLRQHPQVTQALVTGELVAYTTGGATAPQLRDHARRHLPEHMVPGAFVVLERFPLTGNGKIDRGALPAVTSTGTDHAPPRTPTEEVLAAIWAELLRRPTVGRHDNFFALGGDSILSIQAVARANQAGLPLTPPLLFRHQTIAELATVLRDAPEPVGGDDGPASGDVPLTPIQRWFFDLRLPAPNHYNQAVLLRARGSVDRAALDRAVTTLCEHHDALRLTYTRVGHGWRQTYGPPGRQPAVSTVDLSATPPDERLTRLREHAARHQGGLDLDTGPLFTAVHYDTGAGSDHYLLLTAHHLVVDGVSWRILLDDLATVYQGRTALPPRTTSYQRWARHLVDHVNTPHTSSQIPYWTKLVTTVAGTVPRDGDGPNLYRSTGTITRAVAAAGPGPGQTLLLTALARTFAAWTDRPHTLIDIEHHGRHPYAETVSLGRTVGWFTAIHPLRLGEHLDEVPDHGLAYTLLRYHHTGPATDALRGAPTPEVRFNYLGGLDSSASVGPFTLLPDRVEPVADPAGQRPYVLDITAFTMAGELRVTWSFSTTLHRAETIAGLADAMTSALESLAATAGGATHPPAPAADLGEALLSEEDLNVLMNELGDVFAAEGDG